MKLLWNFHVTRTLTNIDFSIVIGGYLVYYNTVVSSNITLYIFQGGCNNSCFDVGQYFNYIDEKIDRRSAVKNYHEFYFEVASFMALEDYFLFRLIFYTPCTCT